MVVLFISHVPAGRKTWQRLSWSIYETTFCVRVRGHTVSQSPALSRSWSDTCGQRHNTMIQKASFFLRSSVLSFSEWSATFWMRFLYFCLSTVYSTASLIPSRSTPVNYIIVSVFFLVGIFCILLRPYLFPGLQKYYRSCICAFHLFWTNDTL